MLVDHKNRIVSVSVPKTGSTSLHYGLMSALDIKFETSNKDPNIYHLTAKDIRKIMGPHKFDSYFSFGVTRNPYDRMVSLFHDFRSQRNVIKEESFEEFIIEGFDNRWRKNIHFRPQSFFLYSARGQVTSEIYRFEEGLESVFDKILDKLKLQSVQLGHARKSERISWQEYYSNPQVTQIVRNFYSEDFEIFNYDCQI